MRELLYGIDSAWIAAALFVSMALAMEAGHRIGTSRQSTSGEAFRSHVNSVAGSLLGVLALLLGFTFSLSLQRYDSRSEAVVEEANAIGTTYLRSALLPEALRSDVRAGLREYVDLRVRASAVPLDDQAQRVALIDQAGRAHDALWRLAVKAAEQNPTPVVSGLFIQALNEMIDAFGSRNAALDRHVPELVLLLLYGTFVMAGAIVGYASGVAGHRASFATYVLVTLIVVLVFVILDLDRPRRGVIQVSQRSLVDLQRSMQADEGASAEGRR